MNTGLPQFDRPNSGFVLNREKALRTLKMVVDSAESLIPTLRQFVTAQGEVRASTGKRLAELAADFDQKLRGVNANTMGGQWLSDEEGPLALEIKITGSSLYAVCDGIHIVVDQDQDGSYTAELLRAFEEGARTFASLGARLEKLERSGRAHSDQSDGSI